MADQQIGEEGVLFYNEGVPIVKIKRNRNSIQRAIGKLLVGGYELSLEFVRAWRKHKYQASLIAHADSVIWDFSSIDYSGVAKIREDLAKRGGFVLVFFNRQRQIEFAVRLEDLVEMSLKPDFGEVIQIKMADIERLSDYELIKQIAKEECCSYVVKPDEE